MFRKIITSVLILTLILSLTISVAFAGTVSNSGTSYAEPTEEELEEIRAMEEYAQKMQYMDKLLRQEEKVIELWKLGLFLGSGNSFELERAATRTEAVILLLRMLGEEEEAKNCTYTHPFTDVPAWADKYIAYAYNKGLTNGVSATIFGSNNDTTPEQFITFTLRALEYSDKDGDFTYKESIKKAEEIGLVEVGAYTNGAAHFFRSDCGGIIHTALTTTKKVEQITLVESLINKNIVDAKKAEELGLYKPYEMIRIPLREDEKTGEMAIFVADVIAQVPGARYGVITGYSGTEFSSNDYEKVYSFEKCKEFAQHEDYFTNNFNTIEQHRAEGGKDNSYILVAVYDNNKTMLAASITTLKDAEVNNYMDFALVNINGNELAAKREKAFNEVFANAVEAPNIITSIEKATFYVVVIDDKTGKVKNEYTDNEFSYKYVIDRNKYPQLAKKIKSFDEFAIPTGTYEIPSGLSTLEVVRTDGINRIATGAYNGHYNITDYAEYTNGWTHHKSEWNIRRYIVFLDNDNKPVAYTSILPSQLKVIDMGTLKAEIYVDSSTNKIVRSVYSEIE